MRRVLLVLVAALALPAAAQAKEITSLALCGPDECSDVDATGYGHSGPFGGQSGGPPPPPGRFYRLDIGVDHGRGAFSVYYEPGSGLLASEDRPGTFMWLRPVPKLASELKETAKRLEPFAAPRITGAEVGSKSVTGDASTYAALLRVSGPPVVPKTSGDAVGITLTASAPNPWTQVALLWYPQDRVLFRSPGTYVRLDEGMAADVQAARGLGDGGGAAVPWIAIAVALAGALALLLLALRRTLRPAPRPAAAP